MKLGASCVARTPGPRYRLNGVNGSFVKYGEDPQESALREGLRPSDPGWGREPEANRGSLDVTLDGLRFTGKVETIPGAYQEYCANVRDAVNGAGELAVKPEEARNGIRLIELGFRSSREGRTIETDLSG